MDKKKNEYISKMKKKIHRWNAEDDKVRDRTYKLKADDLVQYRKQYQELMVNRLGLKGSLSELQNTREAAWEDVQIGVDIVKQALIDSIGAAKLCSNQLV